MSNRHGFEERLLAELRAVVVETAAPATPPHPGGRRVRARPDWRGRLVATAGIAAVLAVAVAAGLPLVTGGNGVTPAYAVSVGSGGAVTVEINALRDAAGLQRKLADAGVPAAVQYLPPGKACKEQTFTPAPDPTAPTKGSIATSADGGIRFTIDRSSLSPGQTLVIYTQDAGTNQPQQPTSVSIAVAQGDVKPCEVVDAADATAPAGPPVVTSTNGSPAESGTQAQP